MLQHTRKHQVTAASVQRCPGAASVSHGHTRRFRPSTVLLRHLDQLACDGDREPGEIRPQPPLVSDGDPAPFQRRSARGEGSKGASFMTARGSLIACHGALRTIAMSARMGHDRVMPPSFRRTSPDGLGRQGIRAFQAALPRAGTEQDWCCVSGDQMPGTLERHDVVVVSRPVHAYLIDPGVESLPVRIERSLGCFERVTMVATPEKGAVCLPHVPRSWGVTAVFRDGHVVDLRTAQPTAPHSALALARLLWRDELACALEQRGARVPFFADQSRLLKILTTDFSVGDAYELVVTQLLAREIAQPRVQR
jgi:hypothetical protein